MRHVGARERFCSPVSCLLLAGPPVQELDPHPHPGGSQTGRGRLPPALSQEGPGVERERTSVKGAELMVSVSTLRCSSVTRKADSGLPPPTGSTKMSSAMSDSVAPSGGQRPRGCPQSEPGLLSRQAVCKSFQIPNFLSSCWKSSPWFSGNGVTLPTHEAPGSLSWPTGAAVRLDQPLGVLRPGMHIPGK